MNEATNDSTTKPTLMELPIAIQTLTVGGKLLTRGFYEQIHAASLIDTTTGQFRGVPLGTVNLHTRACRAADAPHYHVVWLLGEQLRHDTVYQSDVLALFSAEQTRLTELSNRAVEALATVTYILEGRRGLERLFQTEYDDVTQTWRDDTLLYVLDKRVVGACPSPQLRGFSQAEIDEYRQHAGTVPKLLAALRDYDEERCAWRLKARGLWSTLSDLPQLFILR